jgi:hypothetical protein
MHRLERMQRKSARKQLAEPYSSFIESHETADLKRAGDAKHS